MNEAPEPKENSGRLIVRYLQSSKDGATLSDIIQHLRAEHGQDSSELNRTVESILEGGAALGFLERKGSRFLNWSAKEMCGPRRRRRSRCARRRRRRIRRRRSRRRRRRCRCG